MSLIGHVHKAPATLPVVPDPQAEVRYWSRQVCAYALMDDLADWFGVSSETVWRCLSEVTDDMLWMLDCPHGWGLLSDIVRDRLGIVAAPYSPVVH